MDLMRFAAMAKELAAERRKRVGERLRPEALAELEEIMDRCVRSAAIVGQACAEARAKLNARQYEGYLIEQNMSRSVGDAAIDVFNRMQSGESVKELQGAGVAVAVAMFQAALFPMEKN